MTTLRIEQFKDLIATSGWTHESSTEIVLREEGKTYGFGTVTSRFGDLKITAYEGFVYKDGDDSSFSADSDGINKPIGFEGFEVVDEDGDTLGQCYIYELLDSAFYSVDYSEIEEAT
jgi:hypothetical protein